MKSSQNILLFSLNDKIKWAIRCESSESGIQNQSRRAIGGSYVSSYAEERFSSVCCEFVGLCRAATFPAQAWNPACENVHKCFSGLWNIWKSLFRLGKNLRNYQYWPLAFSDLSRHRLLKLVPSAQEALLGFWLVPFKRVQFKMAPICFLHNFDDRISRDCLW